MPGDGVLVDSRGRGRLAAFIVNPARVRGLGWLRTRCAAAGWPPSLFLATSPDEPVSALVSRALAAGAGLIFAVGGDGTVGACAQALAGTEVPLAIVPAGSANLTAKALRIPAGLDAALAVGFCGQNRLIDLADAGGVTFAAMAGIGVDAAVVAAAADLVKRRIGWLAYAAAAPGQLLSCGASFSVRLDGGRPLLRQARSVAVANCGLLPGGVPIAPAARLDDGLLDVVVLGPAGLAQWARVGQRVIMRSNRNDHLLERFRARRVEISTDRVLPRQADGELIGPGSRLTAAVLPGALLVRVPG